MSAALAFVRLFWKPLAAVAVLLALWAWHAHGLSVARREARQQAVSEMQAQLDAYKAQAEKRITEGTRQHEIDIAQLAAIRSEPHIGVVCHRTSPPVRATARISEPQAPGDRALPPRADESVDAVEFDPTEALYALADEADEKNAACRMLNMAVHGMPSAP